MKVRAAKASSGSFVRQPVVALSPRSANQRFACNSFVVGKDRFLLRVSIDSLATAKHGYKCVHSTILVILVVTLYLYMMNDCSFRFRVLSNLQVAVIYFQQYMTTCVHECEQATIKRTGRCLIWHWRYTIITCRHAILGFNRQNIPSWFGHCHQILTSATLHY